MNGNTLIPHPQFAFQITCAVLTLLPYGVLDSILNGNTGTGYKHNDVTYGWGVRVWVNGVIITALWGWTNGACNASGEWVDYTSLLAWDIKEGDYCQPIEIPTDDITRLEIL